jgi:DNA-directed RNA polymerase subunit A'
MSLKGIEFGILSPKAIKEIAGVKITQAELYDPDGFPIEGGLADLHLGVVDPGLKCKTCGNGVGACLGHFGYLELTKPAVNPLYGKKIFMIFKSICRACSKPLATPEELEKMKHPLNEIGKKRRQTCPYCSERQKEVEFLKPTSYREGKIDLTSEQLRQRFEKISDEDVALLKIKGRPEWLILTILPIPPVTVRPSITLETGERSEDDLTHKLVDVVRINERLKKNLELGAPDFIIGDIWELLQYHISTYMDNEISTLPPARHRSGRALRTLIQRLGKKEGRFRGNLSGKRVNFSARTVISPDPRISLCEVGVPLTISKELTLPIRVTESNKSELKSCIKNGPNIWPGANYISRPDGIRKKVTEENKKEIANELDVGFIVERHLQNGDVALFNRQPSLHRMSMMAHRVRIMPYKTFRLNLTATVPYNADFDGDEMNLHIPQTEEAQVEAEILASIKKHIRSPRYGMPVICCKHDHITGSYLLTRKDTTIQKKEAARLMMSIGLEDKIDEIQDTISGKDLFSFILPEGLNMTFRASFVNCKCTMTEAESCTHDTWVIIRDGKLKRGVIDENALGEKKGKIINAIELHYGPDATNRFIDNVSRLALETIYQLGFSISVSDVDITDKARKRIGEILEETENEAKKLIRDYNSGKISKLPGLTQRNVLEMSIQRLGGEAAKKAAEIVREDLPTNNAVIMARTGARGSYVNLSQMCAFVGQEALEGERIHRGYTGRTLSHFPDGDLGLKTRGFVSASYRFGLDSFGFFFDAMNSRENLMDKSLHTRHSGYMERRLVNALQDLRVEYDGSVRDSRDHIVQFKAGEDGIDPAKSDGGQPPLPI